MSRWAVRHPVVALVAWLLVLVAIGTWASVAGGKPNDSFELPGAPSTQAQDLLETLPGAGAEAPSTVNIVWGPLPGDSDVESGPTTQAATALMRSLADLQQVTCVTGPYRANYGRTCPAPAPADPGEFLISAAVDAAAKKLGVTPAAIGDYYRILVGLAPIAQQDPARLAAIARSLPTIARLAQLPPDLLKTLAGVPAADWEKLAGITRAQAVDLVAGFGSLVEVAQLPRPLLDRIAALDPAELAAAAAKLPGLVAQVETDLAALRKAAATYADAADAAARATSPIAPGKGVAYATTTFAGPGTSVSPETVAQVIAVVDAARASHPGWQVGGTGGLIDTAPSGPDMSEVIGLIAAAIILLIAFGSMVAMGLPLVTAITGLVAGQLLIPVAERFMSVASFAPTLAMMIGLGVGIDYAVFVLNRYKTEVEAGAEPKAAAETAVRTAGRAVIFAGVTVIIALTGMTVLGISFFNGLAIAAAAAVVMVMLSAVWMLPALLSLLGLRALAIRMPWARRVPTSQERPGFWSRYSGVLVRRPWPGLVIVLALLGLLAFPAAGLRLGFPDDSTAAPGSVARVGYDLMSEGFGPGVNGPFFVAVAVTKSRDATQLAAVVKGLEATPGVARTLPDSEMLPLTSLIPATWSSDGMTTSVIVTPSTAPSSPETTALLTTLRGPTADSIQSSSGAAIYVGGTQAITADFTSMLARALPVFLLLVVGLGFLALVMLFRSLLIPLTAAITSLLSFAAALGVTVAIFTDGIGAGLLGLFGTGPILPFLPVMMFAILFGLSMDYQVFLVSRMKEAHEHGSDNATAIRTGLMGSGRVVVAAASIMTAVFASFIPTANDTIKLFGVALAASVVIDAFLVRLVLVPCVMSITGSANWWLPRWLGRVLPAMKIE